MIEFVTLENAHKFSGNPIAAQHRLRYKSIIVRQNWNVPQHEEMEFDQYDNPASKYLIYRDSDNIARGVSRFYPTTLPYMLEQTFSYLVTNRELPKNPNVWEGSRFCIDETLPLEMRKIIINEIIVGYLEASIAFNIEAIVGVMYPAYWRSLFINAGWNVEYMGEIARLEDGNKARSAWLPVSQEVLYAVREKTGIYHNIVNFGDHNENVISKAA